MGYYIRYIVADDRPVSLQDIRSAFVVVALARCKRGEYEEDFGL